MHKILSLSQLSPVSGLQMASLSSILSCACTCNGKAAA